MKPSKFVQLDNQTTTDIFQIRNDGKINYSMTLKTDINKYFEGDNLIDCLILEEVDPVVSFDPIAEPLYFGDNLFTGYV